MRLTRLTLDNYRCFPDRQDLDLYPITVVLGKNNSGKSALVRAPLVLSSGIGRDVRTPLDLDALDDDAPELVDLIHKRLEHGGIALDFAFDDDRSARLDFAVTIQNIDEWSTQVVSRWSCHSDDMAFALDWRQSPDDSAERQTCRISGGSEPDREITAEFDGLLPRVEGSQADPRLTRFGPVGDRVVARMERIRHLGPFRNRATRVTAGRDGGRLDPSDIGSTFVQDHVRGGGDLTARANELLAAHFPGWELEVRPSYNTYTSSCWTAGPAR